MTSKEEEQRVTSPGNPSDQESLLPEKEVIIVVKVEQAEVEKACATAFSRQTRWNVAALILTVLVSTVLADQTVGSESLAFNTLQRCGLDVDPKKLPLTMLETLIFLKLVGF